ncbi:MAG: hypothetical protein ACE5EY_04050 [Anaerolineae bacterium]
MNKQLKKDRNEWVMGAVLVLVGLVTLVGRFVEINGDFWGLLFLPALGAGFLLWGVLSRKAGLIIPGNILSGGGLGSFLVALPFADSGIDDGGIFMLAFALGWVAITVLTAVFTKETHWWPLIPGGIMAVIGLGILFGGVFLSILTFMGKIWPVFLILMGIFVIMTANKEKKAV